MKKIICLLLALACSFALFSCGEEEVEEAPEDALIAIAGNSEPTQIKTYTYYTETSTEIVYKGEYTTVYDGESFVLDYTYEKKAVVSLDEIFEGSVQTVPGQVMYKDGKYSTDGGETWTIEAPDATALAIKLNVAKFI